MGPVTHYDNILNRQGPKENNGRYNLNMTMSIIHKVRMVSGEPSRRSRIQRLHTGLDSS